MTLNNRQTEKVADLCGEAGHISVASVVLRYVLDSPNVYLAVTGVVIAFLLWGTSFYLLRT